MRTRFSLAFAVLALLAAVVATTPSTAAGLKQCKLPDSEEDPTIVTGGRIEYIEVKGISCKSALKQADAFGKCRTKKSHEGTCTASKVNGFKCSEKRKDAIWNPENENYAPYSGVVKCKKGSAQVVFEYRTAAELTRCSSVQYPDVQYKAPDGTAGAYGGFYVLIASCDDAKSLAAEQTACRLANGAAGRCTKKVQGYACQEVRERPTPTAITGTTNCANGGKHVQWVWSQG